MSVKKKTKGSPDEIDVHVGNRLRVRRSLLGLSQEKLGEAIGITFQQIQKYEKGVNRISASRLFQFSNILQVPISYFYDQLGSKSADIAIGLSDNDQSELQASGILQKPETLKLIRAYYSIEDENTRKDIYNFIKSMSDRLK